MQDYRESKPVYRLGFHITLPKARLAESYYARLSASGLHLVKSSKYIDSFEKGEPIKYTYRIIPKDRIKGKPSDYENDYIDTGVTSIEAEKKSFYILRTESAALLPPVEPDLPAFYRKGIIKSYIGLSILLAGFFVYSFFADSLDYTGPMVNLGILAFFGFLFFAYRFIASVHLYMKEQNGESTLDEEYSSIKANMYRAVLIFFFLFSIGPNLLQVFDLIRPPSDSFETAFPFGREILAPALAVEDDDPGYCRTDFTLAFPNQARVYSECTGLVNGKKIFVEVVAKLCQASLPVFADMQFKSLLHQLAPPGDSSTVMQGMYGLDRCAVVDGTYIAQKGSLLFVMTFSTTSSGDAAYHPEYFIPDSEIFSLMARKMDAYKNKRIQNHGSL